MRWFELFICGLLIRVVNLEYYKLKALGLFKFVKEMIGVVKEDYKFSELWLFNWFLFAYPKNPLLCCAKLDLNSNANFFAVKISELAIFLSVMIFWKESVS